MAWLHEQSRLKHAHRGHRALGAGIAALAALLCAWWCGAALAGPTAFDLGLHVPPVVVDSEAPPDCTAAWSVINYTTNDLFVARARIAHGDGEKPVNGRMACPAAIPVRVAERALDGCVATALEPKQCVYADMSRGFEAAADIRNTSENAARCTSDKASFIGVACVLVSDRPICASACGETAAEAENQAAARCQDKQQRVCLLKASAPIAMP